MRSTAGPPATANLSGAADWKRSRPAFQAVLVFAGAARLIGAAG